MPRDTPVCSPPLNNRPPAEAKLQIQLSARHSFHRQRPLLCHFHPLGIPAAAPAVIRRHCSRLLPCCCCCSCLPSCCRRVLSHAGVAARRSLRAIARVAAVAAAQARHLWRRLLQQPAAIS